jgi:hypothetical protein
VIHSSNLLSAIPVANTFAAVAGHPTFFFDEGTDHVNAPCTEVVEGVQLALKVFCKLETSSVLFLKIGENFDLTMTAPYVRDIIKKLLRKVVSLELII